MKTKDFLEKRLKEHEKKELFQRAMGMRRLSGNFLEKARHNLVTTRALWALSENEKVKEEIGLSSDYDGYDWVVVTSYYSMYHAALSAIASIGFKFVNDTQGHLQQYFRRNQSESGISEDKRRFGWQIAQRRGDRIGTANFCTVLWHNLFWLG